MTGRQALSPFNRASAGAILSATASTRTSEEQAYDHVAGPAYRPHAVADGMLITGQQGSSGAATAALVIAALERA